MYPNAVKKKRDTCGNKTSDVRNETSNASLPGTRGNSQRSRTRSTQCMSPRRRHFKLDRLDEVFKMLVVVVLDRVGPRAAERIRVAGRSEASRSDHQPFQGESETTEFPYLAMHEEMGQNINRTVVTESHVLNDSI